MATSVKISGLDRSNEGTSCTVYMADMTALNFDAQVTAAQAVQTAIQNVSLIAFDGLLYPAVQTPAETALPANGAAQRESKFKVRVADNVEPLGSFSFEIGGADFTSHAPSGSDFLNLTDAGAVQALVTAIETNCVSRLGNPVTVAYIMVTGRPK